MCPMKFRQASDGVDGMEAGAEARRPVREDRDFDQGRGRGGRPWRQK